MHTVASICTRPKALWETRTVLFSINGTQQRILTLRLPYFNFVLSEKRSARYQRDCKRTQRATESISLESKEELLWDCKMERLFFP